MSTRTRLSPRDLTYERIYTQKRTEVNINLPSCKKPMYFTDCLCVFTTRIVIGSRGRAQVTPCWGSHYKTEESDLHLALLAQWIFQNKFTYWVKLSETSIKNTKGITDSLQPTMPRAVAKSQCFQQRAYTIQLS